MFIQLKSLGRAVLESMRREGGYPSGWDGYDELESVVDDWHSRFLDRRGLESRQRGVVSTLTHEFDLSLRTDVPEFIDRESYSEEGKVREMEAVGEITRRMGGYRAFAAALEPHIDRYLDRKGDATILELGSGGGDLAIELAQRFEGKNVDIEGSDIEPAYVRRANERAENLDVKFRELDALNLGSDGEYDVVFVAQALHHFSPGEVARVVAGALELSDTFVAIDGRRAITTPPLSALFTAPYLNPHLVHDGVVSALKMYSKPELEGIARVAAPNACISTRTIFPGYSVLSVRKDV